MLNHTHREKNRNIFRFLALAIAFFFSFSCVFPPALLAQSIPLASFNLPSPRAMVGLSESFNLPIINGLSVYPDNPLRFGFLINKGDEPLADQAFKKETIKLVKYFMAALTVPKEDLWVNLSPYEKERIIPEGFGVTEMGRDLLAQDYLLKQLTASLIYPEENLGKAFWQRVYQKAKERFGTTDIPINTFNKIWIIPEKAVIYEHDHLALIVESHLKVMLEEDYEALRKNAESRDQPQDGRGITTDEQGKSLVPKDGTQDDFNSRLASQIIREIILPAIEVEVNQGKNFANLRQIYHSMILAAWYKERLKESLLSKVYVDQNKIKGIDVEDKTIKEKIYNQYLTAFKKGVYDYIKEDYDPAAQEIVSRQYFSGGFSADNLVATIGLVLSLTGLSSNPVQAANFRTETAPLQNEFAVVEMAELGSKPQADPQELIDKFLAQVPAPESGVIEESPGPGGAKLHAAGRSSNQRTRKDEWFTEVFTANGTFSGIRFVDGEIWISAGNSKFHISVVSQEGQEGQPELKVEVFNQKGEQEGEARIFDSRRLFVAGSSPDADLAVVGDSELEQRHFAFGLDVDPETGLYQARLRLLSLDKSMEVKYQEPLNVPARLRGEGKEEDSDFVIGGINSSQVFAQLKTLTGIPISKIEEDARRRGFLGQDESLLDVLRKDNDFVFSQGMTHQQLAEPLFAAIHAWVEKFGSGGMGAGETEFVFHGKTFRVGSLSMHIGDEKSIFNDRLIGTTDFEITDPRTHQSFSVASMLPLYIDRYGFYEGRYTHYRINPKDIMDIFFTDEVKGRKLHAAGRGVEDPALRQSAQALLLDVENSLRNGGQSNEIRKVLGIEKLILEIVLGEWPRFRTLNGQWIDLDIKRVREYISVYSRYLGAIRMTEEHRSHRKIFVTENFVKLALGEIKDEEKRISAIQIPKQRDLSASERMNIIHNSIRENWIRLTADNYFPLLKKSTQINFRKILSEILDGDSQNKDVHFLLRGMGLDQRSSFGIVRESRFLRKILNVYPDILRAFRTRIDYWTTANFYEALRRKGIEIPERGFVERILNDLVLVDDKIGRFIWERPGREDSFYHTYDFPSNETPPPAPTRQHPGGRQSALTDMSKPPGGINLNPALLDMQIKRDGDGVPLPLPEQPIENMHIEGFIPILIQFLPPDPMLLGVLPQEKPVDSSKNSNSSQTFKLLARKEF